MFRQQSPDQVWECGCKVVNFGSRNVLLTLFSFNDLLLRIFDGVHQTVAGLVDDLMDMRFLYLYDEDVVDTDLYSQSEGLCSYLFEVYLECS